jgi:hypothetical protein
MFPFSGEFTVRWGITADEGYETADEGPPPPPAPTQRKSSRPRPKIMTPEKVMAVRVVAVAGLLIVTAAGIIGLHGSVHNNRDS